MNQSPFFVDGGSLQPKTPSYVTRPADRELLQHILAGEFCYVLTARQMGKSSLMVRAAQSLREQQVRIAIVDLTIIGTVSSKQWYLGLLRLIRGDLNFQTDVSAWWREQDDLGEPQLFFEFLRDVVLREVAGQITIFIDEIDTTLNLEFRDDFFAAIRAVYNARASNPTFNRLTFVLLGVATPTDLIKDQKRTPFNIGTRIVLQGFSYQDAKPLLRGLERSYPGQGDRILQRILHWTNGHPYLTQKLCLAVTNAHVQQWTNDEIDQLVHSNFFAENARADSNLAFVESRIQDTPQDLRRRMLDLYDDVYSGKHVPNDDRSPVQNYLELFGLVRVETDKLLVSNRIYQEVFDSNWILNNKSADTIPPVPLAKPLLDSTNAAHDDIIEQPSDVGPQWARRADSTPEEMIEQPSDAGPQSAHRADSTPEEMIEQLPDTQLDSTIRKVNWLALIAFVFALFIIIIGVLIYILSN